MTVSKEKTFLDWLFGSSPALTTQTTVQVGDMNLRIEELQREMERERASVLAELEAVRSSKKEAEAGRVHGQAELERANRELLAMKTAFESAQTEVARLTQLAVELRAASARDAESRRKLSGRCSGLQFETDKLRSALELQSKREIELEQALNNQRIAHEEAKSAVATQRVELLRQEERIRELEQALNNQRAAHEEAKSAVAAQRVELVRQEERIRELEQAAARANSEFAAFESATRTQLGAQQAEVEQRQKQLSVARTDVDRLQKELKRQQAGFIQASGRHQTSLESERRAWAVWLGQVWNTLLYTLGPAAPLALETCLGELEPVAHATTTEAAEARLREFLAARSLCGNVAIVEQQSELRLELEPGPALEGTAAGWVGILATRQLAAMLQRPLRTRGIEQAGARLTVHTTSRAGKGASTARGVEDGS